MTTATKSQWRVQYRISLKNKWRNGILFETRSAARYAAVADRAYAQFVDNKWQGYGFGNTRVLRYVKGEK